MDIEDLQNILRRFAAERGWETFHTPKNLATALMVEAAELIEIFQWMTPEESRHAHHDPALKQRIGEELADVLLYLLQVADHTRIDLPLAVRDKLLRNARKYPPTWKDQLDQPVAASESSTHVFVDFENVQPTEDDLRASIPEATKIWVFHGPHQKHIEQRFASYGDAVTAVPISKTGKNALDFHLSFYVGYITSRNAAANIVVISNDTGYEPVLNHAREMGFAVRQQGHTRTKKSVTAPGRKAVAKKTTAAKVPVAKAVPAKKTAAKNAPAKKVAVKKTQAPVAPAAKKNVKANPPGPVKAVAKRQAPAKPLAAKSAAAVSGAATISKRILDALRKMGNRPVKVGSLKRALKPLLGSTMSEPAVAEAFANLIASGAVVVGQDGGLTYPQFD